MVSVLAILVDVRTNARSGKAAGPILALTAVDESQRVVSVALTPRVPLTELSDIDITDPRIVTLTAPDMGRRIAIALLTTALSKVIAALNVERKAPQLDDA